MTGLTKLEERALKALRRNPNKKELVWVADGRRLLFAKRYRNPMSGSERIVFRYEKY